MRLRTRRDTRTRTNVSSLCPAMAWAARGRTLAWIARAELEPAWVPGGKIAGLSSQKLNSYQANQCEQHAPRKGVDSPGQQAGLGSQKLIRTGVSSFGPRAVTSSFRWEEVPLD